MLMCRDLVRIASDYLDGELGAVRKLSIRLHMMMCRHCRSFVANLRTSTILIRAHSDMQVDELLITRIDAEVGRALATDKPLAPDD